MKFCVILTVFAVCISIQNVATALDLEEQKEHDHGSNNLEALLDDNSDNSIDGEPGLRKRSCLWNLCNIGYVTENKSQQIASNSHGPNRLLRYCQKAKHFLSCLARMQRGMNFDMRTL